MRQVLVFGIFDGVHPGHIDFFRQARERGDFLIVAVGQPSASQKLKNKLPKHSLAERIRFVQNVDYVDKAIPGDTEQGSYMVILREKPDIICLGYDQDELAEDLRRWMQTKKTTIPIEFLAPHEPGKYHTRILR